MRRLMTKRILPRIVRFKLDPRFRAIAVTRRRPARQKNEGGRGGSVSGLGAVQSGRRVSQHDLVEDTIHERVWRNAPKMAIIAPGNP